MFRHKLSRIIKNLSKIFLRKVIFEKFVVIIGNFCFPYKEKNSFHSFPFF